MKIAVIGAGAIGGVVAGYLKSKGEDVCLAGHPDSVAAIKNHGLQISGARGNFNIEIEAADTLSQPPDLAIFATKTQDLAEALNQNLTFLKQAVILTTQNGIGADELIAQHLPEQNIISSIVMFGATLLEPGKILHNFEGSWIFGRLSGKNDDKVLEVSRVLAGIFPSIVSDNIKGMKYLKVFVNANNCIPAILGRSMQESFSDIDIAKISIAVWKEGLEVVKRSGITLVSLPDFPLERLTKLTSLPLAEGAKIYSGIMLNLSKEPLYGSILQSINRSRQSEIDYINGEFVRLAEDSGAQAALNKKLVEMVHKVEQAHKFFTKEDLLGQVKGLYN